ncbi:MAG TPA: hypothetical protein VK171_05290 [Fimbriimonas sp.]|nr:hypothetical protein [Fimbriimonas sp.]
MSEFKVTVWAGANMQGASWSETVDLVDDLGLAVDRAEEILSSPSGVHDDLEDEVFQFAVDMAGFECGWCRLEIEEVKS